MKYPGINRHKRQEKKRVDIVSTRFFRIKNQSSGLLLSWHFRQVAENRLVVWQSWQVAPW